MTDTQNAAIQPQIGVVVSGDETARVGFSKIAPRNLIIGTENPDIIFGTPGNDEIRALGGDDYIYGTTGNDLVDGGTGKNTIDYSNLRRAITVFPRGFVNNGGSNGGQLANIQVIIGAPGQQNTVDASQNSPEAFLDVNLEKHIATAKNIPGGGDFSLTVKNFVNVEGTSNADKIIGSNAANIINGNGGNDNIDGLGGNDTLSGNLGNDIIKGGDGNDKLFGGIGSDELYGDNGNDVLQGSENAPYPGPEIDKLTGGAGVDTFILGDKSGSFYKQKGKEDYALITDFSFGEQITLGIGDVYDLEKTSSGFNLFVVKGDFKDLIAEVTLGAEARPALSRGDKTATGLEAAISSTLNSLEDATFTIGSGESKGFFKGAA
ncbi:MAG: hypothetical protein KME64_14100 [Scytonematopsis contorta HA4267-MV1]|jgi:Ca2+-binding RTX toxin-like protein|nr:hypothetical protein [Scytonematopsis contorta HA4267-MV1]